MMQKWLLLAAVIGLMACCGGPSDKATDVGNSTVLTGCYAYINSGRDSVLLQLHAAEHMVTGNMVYKLFEKDANTGTIRGELKGDTIIAEYDFVSEGVRSVREVVFLKKGSRLLEGYGEVEERNGSVVFKSRKGLHYGKGITLRKVGCPE